MLREEALGIDLWNESNCRVGRGHDHCVNIPGPDPLRLWGNFVNHGKGVDYRILIRRLIPNSNGEGFADPEHLWFDICQDAATAAAFVASHGAVSLG